MLKPNPVRRLLGQSDEGAGGGGGKCPESDPDPRGTEWPAAAPDPVVHWNLGDFSEVGGISPMLQVGKLRQNEMQ